MAVTFRQQLDIDLATMMDQTVFGLSVTLDGVPFLCCEASDHGAPFKNSQDIPGLNTKTRRLIFRAVDMPQAPVEGQIVEIDGEDWYLTSSDKPLGHVILDFSREVS